MKEFYFIILFNLDDGMNEKVFIWFCNHGVVFGFTGIFLPPYTIEQYNTPTHIFHEV